MKSDIICVQVTWFEADPMEPITKLKEHYVHGRSKGIALFTKFNPIHIESTQSVTCSIIKATYLEYDLINVYRFSEGNSITQFTEEILPFLDPARTQIIVGDMNIDLIKNSQNHLTSNLEQKGFHQLVGEPTHVLGGLIDHVYFYTPKIEASCTLYKQHTVFWSDHTCQSILLQTNADQNN